MLLAAGLRQQADEYVLKCCDSATEETNDFVSASKLFQRAAGIYNYVDEALLASEDPKGTK